MQQDTDPKYQQVHLWMFHFPNQSPDFNENEMLWHDLKQALHAEKTYNAAEFFFKVQRQVGQNFSSVM